MGTPDENIESRLEPDAVEMLTGYVREFREILVISASKAAIDHVITEADIHSAFKRQQYPTPGEIEFADSQAVISQALRENRAAEWVSYGMALVLFVVGLLLLIIGATTSDLPARVGFLTGGSIVELLILLPFRFAINSRRHNIALRMLGIILNRVDDPKKLASLLRDTFFTVVVGAAPSKLPIRE